MKPRATQCFIRCSLSFTIQISSRWQYDIRLSSTSIFFKWIIFFFVTDIRDLSDLLVSSRLKFLLWNFPCHLIIIVRCEMLHGARIISSESFSWPWCYRAPFKLSLLPNNWSLQFGAKRVYKCNKSQYTPTRTILYCTIMSYCRTLLVLLTKYAFYLPLILKLCIWFSFKLHGY